MKIVIFNILFLSLAFQLSCSKDVPKVVNPNSNYQFNCPKINSICPFRNNIGEENWIWVNSGITPIPNDSYIRVDSKNRILEYHVNNRYFFGYQFQTDPNDCSSIFVKDRPDAKDLRTIRTIANDSMIIIYDPIICPNEGCIAIKNSKYSNYAYANLKKLGCQNIDYKNINCPCSDDKTGFQCKSKFHYLDIFSEEFTLCAQKLKNNNIVILTRGDSKLSLVCIDKSKNIIWKTDLSNFFSYFGLKHKFDQNQILEDINGNILVILPKSNSQLELVLNVVVINQFGKIINTVSNNIAKASDNNYVKSNLFSNNDIIVETKSDFYRYLLLSNKGVLKLNKISLTKPNYSSEPINSFVIGNYFYVLYSVADQNNFKHFLYKYSENLDYLDFIELKPKIDNVELNLLSNIQLTRRSDKIILLGESHFTGQVNFATLWIVYDLNFNQLSSGYIQTGVLSDWNILADFVDGNLRIISGNDELYVTDYALNTGKMVKGFWFKRNIYNDYIPKKTCKHNKSRPKLLNYC